MTVTTNVSWVAVVSGALNVLQVVALAYIAARYRRNGGGK